VSSVRRNAELYWFDMLCAVLSAFIGPLGGGYLMNVLGFEMSAFIIGCCSL